MTQRGLVLASNVCYDKRQNGSRTGRSIDLLKKRKTLGLELLLAKSMTKHWPNLRCRSSHSMSSWREQPNTLHLEALVNVSKVEGDLWACADVLSQMIWAQMDYRWLWVLASFPCIPVDYFVPISDITVPMIANEMEASALCTTVLKYHHTNVLPRRLLNWTRGDPSSVTPIGTASGCQA